MTGDVLADVAALAGQSQVQRSSRLVADLGFDSLAIAELVVLLAEYGVEVPDRQLDDATFWRQATVADVLGGPSLGEGSSAR